MSADYPCGHPRTPANTKARTDRAVGSCRICRQKLEREAQRRRRAKIIAEGS